ncbi:hypothetical protein XELAEV_18013635mg [Xenopus laevis]|uniref:C2 domain-containing protein n=1 Tax=Xenopus laevis TaxID=8355 RepID=A0A974HZC5_XENLA|nr:hypothetical protein XELAEV_18013635mg [Xenopus laevis]
MANMVLMYMWPYLQQYFGDYMKSKIQPKIQDSNVFLSSFKFLKIDLGRKNMAILGADRMKVTGTVRVVLAPLMPTKPLVGMITWYFPTSPVVEISSTQLKPILKIGGTHFILSKIIKTCLKPVVYPKSAKFKLSKTIDTNALYFRLPKNVICVHILEAAGLYSKDLIQGLRNSYVVAHVGGKTVKTKVAINSLNPAWNQAFQMPLTDIPFQEITFEVLSYNFGENRLLGSCQAGVENILTQPVTDMWLPLKNTPSGKLHVRFERLNLAQDCEKLEEVLMENKNSSAVQIHPFGAAILYVRVRSAKDLQIPNSDELPTSMVLLNVLQTKAKTKAIRYDKDPVWNKTIHFPIQNPYEDELHIEVKDVHHGRLGTFSMSICDLLLAENLTVEGCFNLRSSNPLATINIKMELRILVPPHLDERIEETTSDDLNSEELSIQILPKKIPKPSKDSGTAGTSHGNETTGTSRENKAPRTAKTKFGALKAKIKRASKIIRKCCCPK